jgi:hypothetical protein
MLSNLSRNLMSIGEHFDVRESARANNFLMKYDQVTAEIGIRAQSRRAHISSPSPGHGTFFREPLADGTSPGRAL